MISLKRDYIWNTTGVLLQNAVSPILLLVVTRLNGIEAAGVFSFAFAVSLMLWALAMWGGRTYQISDTQMQFDPRSYIVVRIFLAFVVILVAVLFCIFNQYDIFKSSLIIGLVLFKIIESFSDVVYGILQVNNQLHLSGKSLAVKAILGLIIFAVLDIITNNLLIAVIGIVCINIVIFFCYDLVKVNNVEKISFPIGELKKYIVQTKEILHRCFGVFIIFFLAMFSLNIPRYFVDIYNVQEVGYFGIIAMPITLIVLVISFILQPNVLRLSRLYRDKSYALFESSANKILGVSLAIGLFTLLGTVLIGTWILQIVFGVSFDDYNVVLVVMVAGGVANALVTVYLNLFVIMRRITFALVVLIAINIILIPASYTAVLTNGLVGGVTAFAVANAIQLMLISIYFRSLKQFKGVYEKN